MTRIQVTKHAPDGRPPYRYEATRIDAPPGWIAVVAKWPLRQVDVGPVSFKPGDTLTEFFALDDYFNAFLIHRDNGAFGGWYCNITHPTIVRNDEIHWHDLYLDILIDTEGCVHIEDEDELADSGLAASNPSLHHTIFDAKERLLGMIERNDYPFSFVE